MANTIKCSRIINEMRFSIIFLYFSFVLCSMSHSKRQSILFVLWRASFLFCHQTYSIIFSSGVFSGGDTVKVLDVISQSEKSFV